MSSDNNFPGRALPVPQREFLFADALLNDVPIVTIPTPLAFVKFVHPLSKGLWATAYRDETKG